MTEADMKKYEQIYHEMMKLTSEDISKLIKKASSEDMKNFYELVREFLLQKNKQK